MFFSALATLKYTAAMVRRNTAMVDDESSRGKDRDHQDAGDDVPDQEDQAHHYSGEMIESWAGAAAACEVGWCQITLGEASQGGPALQTSYLKSCSVLGMVKTTNR